MMQTPADPYHEAATTPIDKVSDRDKDYLIDPVDKVADVASAAKDKLPASQSPPASARP